MIRTFIVYDSARSDVVACAAFFATTNMLVIEDLFDDGMVGIENELRVCKVYDGHDPRQVLKNLFDTDFVENAGDIVK